MIMNCRLDFWRENLVSGRAASLLKGWRSGQQRVNKICALISTVNKGKVSWNNTMRLINSSKNKLNSEIIYNFNPGPNAH